VGELPVVVGNRTQLVQLFQNLLGNAIKYRGEHAPRIRVAADLKDSEWVFSIADNGIGIDPKHHEQIFEVFRRLHTQDAFPGTGIGLAVCRRIVQRHGGRIWVESERGKGSTFLFTIPDARSSDHESA
jgi:light-regulated signal transduction histidine kinase (bacteriophytochrome)